MTQSDEYQKACERAANKYYDEQVEQGELNSRHMDDLSQAFQAGIAWANANPSPRVMRLLAFVCYVSSCSRADNKFQEIAEEALADFESEGE